VVERVGQRDLPAHAVAEQEDGQPVVPGGGEPAEGVEVGEPVGIVHEV
jgi:hypothetical protein